MKESDLEYLASIYEFDVEIFQKRRKMQSSILTLVIMLLAVIRVSFLYFGLALFSGYIVYKFEYWNYKDKLKKVNKELASHFPVWIRLLLAYLKNGQNNLYTSIEKSAKYFNDTTRHVLIQFANEINIDHTKRPYVEFAKKFENIQLANTILLSLYYYNNNTSNQAILEQLVLQNDVLLQNEIEHIVEIKSKKLFNQGTIAFVLSMMYILIFIVIILVQELSTIIGAL